MHQTTPIKIVIADKQYLIEYAIKGILSEMMSYELIGTVNNPFDFFSIINCNEVDLIFIDPAIFDNQSIEQLKKLRKEFPNIKLILLSNTFNKSDLNEYIQLGIKNIISKNSDKEEFTQVIDSVFKNKKYFSGDVLNVIIDSGSRYTIEESTHLTATEKEVVKLIASGKTTKEIAELKHISFHTVMSHRKNIFRKLNINNASELVVYAMRTGIVETIEYFI